LEAELPATKRAKELLKEAMPPKGRFAIIKVMASEGSVASIRPGYRPRVTPPVVAADVGGLGDAWLRSSGRPGFMVITLLKC
jgi:hypothetical protein